MHTSKILSFNGGIMAVVQITHQSNYTAFLLWLAGNHDTGVARLMHAPNESRLSMVMQGGCLRLHKICSILFFNHTNNYYPDLEVWTGFRRRVNPFTSRLLCRLTARWLRCKMWRFWLPFVLVIFLDMTIIPILMAPFIMYARSMKVYTKVNWTLLLANVIPLHMKKSQDKLVHEHIFFMEPLLGLLFMQCDWISK